MKRIRLIFLLSLPLFLSALQGRQQSPYEGNGKLKRIYFNLYTDSIKPILNYYVNVEGEYSNGRILPMDTSVIFITADQGTMSGNAWIAPPDITFNKVTFRTTARQDPSLTQTITVYLKQIKDPRDDKHFEEGDLPVAPGRKYRRHR
jgi:hypothetical protein